MILYNCILCCIPMYCTVYSYITGPLCMVRDCIVQNLYGPQKQGYTIYMVMYCMVRSIPVYTGIYSIYRNIQHMNMVYKNIFGTVTHCIPIYNTISALYSNYICCIPIYCTVYFYITLYMILYNCILCGIPMYCTVYSYITQYMICITVYYAVYPYTALYAPLLHYI